MAATPPPNRFLRSNRSQDTRTSASQTTTPTTLSSSNSSTAADLEACASFLAEVDEWLIRINQRVSELEHRHKKNLSGEAWDWMAKHQENTPREDDGGDRASERYPANVRKK